MSWMNSTILVVLTQVTGQAELSVVPELEHRASLSSRGRGVALLVEDEVALGERDDATG